MKLFFLLFFICLNFTLSNRGSNFQNINSSEDFFCLISSSRNNYRIGEIPEIEVEIINDSPNDKYLIGSLDGSEIKWRYPHCYFRIEKPFDFFTPTKKYWRCGNVNPLRKEDFTFVKSGESFDPYGSLDMYGYFQSTILRDKNTFLRRGKYKITFFYSTLSVNIEEYSQWGKEDIELENMFQNVPNIRLQSNTLELTFR